MEKGEKKISLNRLQKEYDFSIDDLEALEKEEGLMRYRTPSNKSRWFLSEILALDAKRKKRLEEDAEKNRGWENSGSFTDECLAEAKRGRKNPVIQTMCDKNYKDVMRESARKTKRTSKRKETRSEEEEAFLGSCWDAM